MFGVGRWVFRCQSNLDHDYDHEHEPPGIDFLLPAPSSPQDEPAVAGLM